MPVFLVVDLSCKSSYLLMERMEPVCSPVFAGYRSRTTVCQVPEEMARQRTDGLSNAVVDSLLQHKKPLAWRQERYLPQY